MKMCNYENHRRFSLRCLGNGIIPVIIRLKNQVRTQRSVNIIHKAERSLLNERVSDNIIHKAERSLLNERVSEVNMTLNRLKHDVYMYQNKLSGIISEDLMKQSIEFIKEYKEARHKAVMDRQIKKYIKLWAQKYDSGTYMYSTDSSNGTGGCSNQDKSNTKCWVVNLSQQPLTQAQETVLAHRPNFTVTPKTPLSKNT